MGTLEIVYSSSPSFATRDLRGHPTYRQGWPLASSVSHCFPSSIGYLFMDSCFPIQQKAQRGLSRQSLALVLAPAGFAVMADKATPERVFKHISSYVNEKVS